MTTSEPAGASNAAPARPAAIILVVAVAAFTANLDLSIVTLALPSVGRAFGTSQSELAWTLTAYVLPYAISILAVGRLGDGFGHRRVLVIGAVVFGFGAIVSAGAPTYPALLVGRVLQGLGGSALLTIGLAIISANFSGAARGRALGIYFAAGAGAAVIGPIVGGLLTSVGGWQAIFWCQIPLAAVVAIVAAICCLPVRRASVVSLDGPGPRPRNARVARDERRTAPGQRLGLDVARRACCLVPCRGGPRGIRSSRAVGRRPAMQAIGLRSRIYVASIFLRRWRRLVRDHLGDGHAVRSTSRRFVDWTRRRRTIVLTPWPFLSAFVFPRASRIVASLGPERTMIGSLVVAAAIAAVLMVTFDEDGTPFVVVSIVAALGGVPPLALGVTASTVCALAEFPAAEAGVASGVFNSLRQVGASFGSPYRRPRRPRPGGECNPGSTLGSVWAFAESGGRLVVFSWPSSLVMPRRPVAPLAGARLS